MKHTRFKIFTYEDELVTSDATIYHLQSHVNLAKAFNFNATSTAGFIGIIVALISIGILYEGLYFLKKDLFEKFLKLRKATQSQGSLLQFDTTVEPDFPHATGDANPRNSLLGGGDADSVEQLHARRTARRPASQSIAGSPEIIYLFISSVLHGCYAFIGYTLMNAVMTFNTWILIATISGMGIGYFFFRTPGDTCEDDCHSSSPVETFCRGDSDSDKTAECVSGNDGAQQDLSPGRNRRLPSSNRNEEALLPQNQSQCNKDDHKQAKNMNMTRMSKLEHVFFVITVLQLVGDFKMSENAEGTWCLIESDPGVFTELIREFGCKGLQVEELWSLEEEDFNRLKPVHGLIFLFKWIGPSTSGSSGGSVVEDSRLEKIFFPRQVINNACASFAIISTLMNLEHSDVELGKVLSEFKDFTKSFDPAMKGLALSNSETIRSVHNSFARQTLFEFEEKAASKDDDVYHFVSFLPINGRLYELDGLRDGPVDHGAIPDGKEWTNLVRTVLQERINRYNEGEIHFNLMAIVSDRKTQAERKLADLEAIGQATPDKVLELKQILVEEEAKRSRFKLENIRRKHNYLPLIVQFLKELAQQKQLLPLYEKAKEKSQTRVKKQPAS
ncbi:Ubiquitin carboxyl-terminal hydrolase isozyme L5 [Orchesella cincta]|uniref:Ubiquitin carboxyl-terminal hydrolase n=1 Tax=Orchesella cincta TaxID=48709 RepID=A0A1D2NJC8_ORCCI|nr:Ubiquitin carboxyl-terminal hydrolase isozyme L5 [Orchesella cincta]